MAQQADGTVYINTKIDTSGVETDTRKIQSALKRTAGTVSRIGNSIKNAFSFGKISGGENAEKQVETIGEKVERLKESLKYLSEIKGLSFGNEEYDSVYQALVSANEELKQYRSNLAESALAGQNAGQSVGFIQASLNGLKMAAHAPVSAVKALGNAIKALPRKALDLVVDGLKKVGSVAKSAAKSIGGSLLSGVKKLGASMLGLGKSTKSSNNAFGGGLKTILKYGFGIRSLYILVRKLRTALVEGFKNLAQYDSATNASISSMMSALTQLKNSFATAFAPILNVVAPILTSFINLISAAVSKVGMLIAALTGQKTFTKAVAVQQDYAASLGDTSKGIKDTTKATKKAEKETEDYLSGLDEIRRWESPDKSDADSTGVGAGGGGGYAAPTPAEMFETVPIENSLKDLADKIRGFFQSEDWEGLGEFVAEGINRGMKKIKQAISWENVGPTVTHFVTAFTTTFNSLVDNIDWDLLGRTIGTGINTLVKTLTLLIEGINWVNLGSKFADGLLGLVDEVDWFALGRVIGDGFMILPNIALGFVRRMKWGVIGIAIGDALNGVFSSLNFGVLGEVLGGTLTGIFDIAINFANTFDWKKFGDNIVNGINKFFEKFDGAKFGQAATSLISGLLDTIIEVVTKTDWAQIWRDIIDFLVNVNWVELIGKLAIAAWNLISGIVTGLIQAIAETDWGAVWDSILQAFKDFFGIASPSTVMESMGVYLMQGLFNGISSLVETVLSVFGDIKNKISKKMDETKKKISNTAKDIKTDVSSKWDDLKKKTSDTWDNIKNAVGDKTKDLKDYAAKKFQETKDSASQKFEEIKTAVTDKLEVAKSMAQEKFESIKTAATEKLDTAKTTAQEKFEDIRKSALEKLDAAKTNAQTAFESIKTAATDKLDIAKSKAQTAFEDISDSAQTKMKAAWKSVKDKIDDIKDIFDRLSLKLPKIDIPKIKLPHFSIKGEFSLMPPKVPTLSVSWYARGGLFNQPALIGVGEDGKEAVLPLENRKTMSAIANSIVSNLPKPYLASGAVIPPKAQYSTVNIETSRRQEMDDMYSMMKDVLSKLGQAQNKGSNIPTIRIPVVLDGRQVFEAVITEAKMKQMVSGRNPFEMA